MSEPGQNEAPQAPTDAEGHAGNVEQSSPATGEASPNGHEDAMKTPTAGIPSVMPAGPIHVRFYGATNVGLIREHNEDNLTVANLTTKVRDLPDGLVQEAEVLPDGILLAVCDGMGGAAAGEVASQMAVDTIFEIMSGGETCASRDDLARRLVYSIEDAGGRIFGSAKMDRSRRGMGTTATAAALIDKVLFVGQVGDSRAYVLRNGELSLITKDQSLVNQLIEAGQLTEEEAESFEHSNIILQALGTTEDVSVDLTFLELRQGDRIMMCSDGLSGMVHSEIIREVLAEVRDIPACCARLIEMANAGGGHDNITCIIADFDGPGLAPAAGAPKAAYQQYPLPVLEEDDERAARRTSMKSGATKPGSDVKRAPIEYDDPAPTLPTGAPIPWSLVALGAILLGALLLFAFFIVFGLTTTAEPDVPPMPPPPIVPSAPVELRIRTDISNGHLFVDGEDYGPVTSGADVQLELSSGVHRLEIRVAGSPIVSSELTLRPGIPGDVLLSGPSAEEDGAEPPPTPVPTPAPPGATGTPVP
ncbi:MAG: serine/threonine-protein phosphatase [Myxococcales bacterium]|nr:serine/threonine-protein phosphatase [Myxococcales bacterium]MCB9628730.1 serine/threonine-protein phosphatase [Sandaracinaceae bacterium]